MTGSEGGVEVVVGSTEKWLDVGMIVHDFSGRRDPPNRGSGPGKDQNPIAMSNNGMNV